MLHLGNENKKFRYVMGGQDLDSVESEKDVGVMMHQSLKQSLQGTKAAEKANQVNCQRQVNISQAPCSICQTTSGVCCSQLESSASVRQGGA